MKKGVLFDKDGTLLDFEATWFPVVREVLRTVEERFRVPAEAMARLRAESGVTDTGFARESLLQSGATSEILACWEGIFAEAGIRVPRRELLGVFDKASTEGISAVRTVVGAEALLDRLRRNGFHIGVVTGDDRASTERGLLAAGLLGRFDYIAADGDGFPPKPDPSAAREFRRRFGVHSSDLTMFGDSVVDMEFARNAGIRFIGMKTSCNDYARFEKEGFPVIEDFGDAQAIEALLA